MSGRSTCFSSYCAASGAGGVKFWCCSKAAAGVDVVGAGLRLLLSLFAGLRLLLSLLPGFCRKMNRHPAALQSMNTQYPCYFLNDVTI